MTYSKKLHRLGITGRIGNHRRAHLRTTIPTVFGPALARRSPLLGRPLLRRLRLPRGLDAPLP